MLHIDATPVLVFKGQGYLSRARTEANNAHYSVHKIMVTLRLVWKKAGHVGPPSATIWRGGPSRDVGSKSRYIFLGGIEA